AGVLCLLPHHYARSAAVTLLLFRGGRVAARQASWAGTVLPAATPEATVVSPAPDQQTTHSVRRRPFRGMPLLPAVGRVLQGEYVR
ncbi:ComEC family protein, partial [Salmonella enterica subsp. enterica serovar Infantis]